MRTEFPPVDYLLKKGSAAREVLGRAHNPRPHGTTVNKLLSQIKNSTVAMSVQKIT